ncbi:MAG: LuxR C-terminal-related transcriptional regulator [Deltaproteobacteria bacterium]
MKRWLIAIIFLIQALCAFFFVSDILASVLGLRSVPIAWETRELMEIGAAIGLILGVFFGAYVLWRSLRAQAKVEQKLRSVQGDFMVMLEEHFTNWGLTASERDVALFAIKGMSTAEIAGLRATSEGTVKAQTNAIYRKAGVTGRPQLLSIFIEDLMEAKPA